MRVRQRKIELLIRSGSHPSQKIYSFYQKMLCATQDNKKERRKKRTVLTRNSSSQHRNPRPRQVGVISCSAASAARLLHLKKQLERIVRSNFEVRSTCTGTLEWFGKCQDISILEDETTSLSLNFGKRLPTEEVSYKQKKGKALQVFFHHSL
jgi:hypothetical protein